jgi:hypothetical protein
MAKTLKDFLEGYLKVKSADEQKFIDKHVTAKTADRNGNGDDVFKGSTKPIDRRKERKGYNPGEDEKVYESSNPYRDTFGPGGTVQQKQAAKNWLTPDDTGSEAKARTPEQHKKRHAEILSVGSNKNATIAHLGKLAAHSYKVYHDLKEALTGSQHKIDANKNGKVDAHDFKLLRGKKKVAEALSDPGEEDDGWYTHSQMHGSKKSEKHPKGISAAEWKSGIRWDNRKNKRINVKEEVEELDELTGRTMKSYYKKADADSEYNSKKANQIRPELSTVELDSKDKAPYKFHSNETRKRNAGMAMAAKKLAAGLRKEDAELDEDVGAEIADLIRKKNAASPIARKTIEAQIARLRAQRSKMNEETEELEELSEPTVRTYYNKAGEQGKKIADKMKMVGGDFSSDGSDTKTLKKRAAGRTMALKRRSGEIKMSEESEQIDELSKKTLGSYVVKSLAPSSEKSVSNLASKGGYKLGQAHDDDYTAGEKEDAKSVKRSLGVLTAVRKMTKESRVQAIASKLTAQYASAPLNKEERLQDRLSDISESHQRVMLEVFGKLNEDNKTKFMTACATPEGVEQMLDFAITYRGE